jgi:hypothetical protein
VHPWRPIVIGGAAFSALAMLLPFASVPVAGVYDGIDAAAWPALLPLIPVVGTAALGDWARGLRPLTATGLVVLTCGAVLYAVVKIADAVVAVRSADGASLGAGSFVLTGGAAVVLIGCVLAMARGLE